MPVDPSEEPTTQPPANDESGDEAAASPVDMEIGRLRLDAEVAAWVTDHLNRYKSNGWGHAEAVSDLLATAYFKDQASRETKEDRHAKMREVAEAMAALTDEQKRIRDTETAYLNLGLGMGDVESGLKIAARLDLPVQWLADSVEMPAPALEEWPRPQLAEIPPAFLFDDSPPAAGRAGQ